MITSTVSLDDESKLGLGGERDGDEEGLLHGTGELHFKMNIWIILV